jgi:hypothetical protein
MAISISGSGSITGTGSLTVGSGSGTALTVDTSNRVISSTNKPMVWATMQISGWANYGGDPGSIAIYNTVKINNGNNYNSSTGIFTAPIAGYYRMMASVLAGQGNYSTHLRARKNNVVLADSGAHMNQISGWCTIWVINLVSCAVNDTLSWYASGNGSSIYNAADYCQMIIEFVG